MTSTQNATGAASVPQAEVYRAARQDKPWGHELIFAAIAFLSVTGLLKLFQAMAA